MSASWYSESPIPPALQDLFCGAPFWLGARMPPRSQAGSTLPVWVVVMTEFGRRLRANRSQGTDHGHGSAMLVLAELLSLDALGLRVRDAVFPGLAPRPYLGLLNGAVG